jgi:hypothetical protein
MQAGGHDILWTPPYTPDLQPIEMYWGLAKNYVAECSTNATTLREVVNTLRKGWYGNVFDRYEDDIDPLSGLLKINDRVFSSKDPIDCRCLFQHTIDEINHRYIQMCDGVDGVLGELVVDDSNEGTLAGLPADMVMLNITNNPENDFVEVEDDDEEEAEDDLEDLQDVENDSQES